MPPRPPKPKHTSPITSLAYPSLPPSNHINPSITLPTLSSPSPSISDDRLGTYIQAASKKLRDARSWNQFILSVRGTSDIHPSISTINHPANISLEHLRNYGAPITVSSHPWTLAQKDNAIERGSHPSTLAHAPFLREEMADMVSQHFWVVVEYTLVRHLNKLRLSPMGVVPQRDSRPRPIVDYTYSGINANTNSPSPTESMQFGHTLDRLLHRIHHANQRFGPVYMIKIDLADGLISKRHPCACCCLPLRSGQTTTSCTPTSSSHGMGCKPSIFLLHHRNHHRYGQSATLKGPDSPISTT